MNQELKNLEHTLMQEDEMLNEYGVPHGTSLPFPRPSPHMLPAPGDKYIHPETIPQEFVDPWSIAGLGLSSGGFSC